MVSGAAGVVVVAGAEEVSVGSTGVVVSGAAGASGVVVVVEDDVDSEVVVLEVLEDVVVLDVADLLDEVLSSVVSAEVDALRAADDPAPND